MMVVDFEELSLCLCSNKLITHIMLDRFWTTKQTQQWYRDRVDTMDTLIMTDSAYLSLLEHTVKSPILMRKNIEANDEAKCQNAVPPYTCVSLLWAIFGNTAAAHIKQHELTSQLYWLWILFIYTVSLHLRVGCRIAFPYEPSITK